MTAAREAILRLFRISENRAAAVVPKDAIFPGHDAPVVRPAADGERELVQMSWGFVLPQPGKAPRRVTNTRDDKARSSSFWRDSFEKRRCLVPVTCFAEPKEVTPATWHWFALNGEEPRPLFAFAGLWRRHVGPVKKDGSSVELDVYLICVCSGWHSPVSIRLCSNFPNKRQRSDQPRYFFGLSVQTSSGSISARLKLASARLPNSTDTKIAKFCASDTTPGPS